MLGKKKKRLSKKIMIISVCAIVLIMLVIFTISLKDDRKLNPVEAFFKDTLLYTERVVTFPFRYVIDKVNEYSKLKDVKKENDLLETSIDRALAIETENIELRRQLDKLKEELNIEYVLTDYEYLNATVISRNIGYWYNTITIDKGTYNGVETDMVVINGKGLIGRVIRTTTFTSDVRLITTSDTNNKISVIVSNGTDTLYGLINSYDYDSNSLIVEGISNTKSVNIGDYVYTSGLGGVFPSGVLIGQVSEITTDSYDLAKIIKVTPSLDFADINYVSVLKRKDK